jgi:hypothetical protein
VATALLAKYSAGGSMLIRGPSTRAVSSSTAMRAGSIDVFNGVRKIIKMIVGIRQERYVEHGVGQGIELCDALQVFFGGIPKLVRHTSFKRTIGKRTITSTQKADAYRDCHHRSTSRHLFTISFS